MRFVLALILAVAVGAAAPPKAADSDPVTLIAAIYQTYLKDNVPVMTDIYSKRLQGLIDKDERETPEGDVGRIDWDVFIDGQDWRLSEFKIVPVSQQADKAQVRATFINLGEPKNILYDLVLEDGHWRIDEIQETLPTRWIMSKILSDHPGAFPDAPQQ